VTDLGLRGGLRESRLARIPSAIQVCLCSTGNWLVMIGARVPARSSITTTLRLLRQRSSIPSFPAALDLSISRLGSQ